MPSCTTKLWFILQAYDRMPQKLIWLYVIFFHFYYRKISKTNKVGRFPWVTVQSYHWRFAKQFQQVKTCSCPNNNLEVHKKTFLWYSYSYIMFICDKVRNSSKRMSCCAQRNMKNYSLASILIPLQKV